MGQKEAMRSHAYSVTHNIVQNAPKHFIVMQKNPKNFGKKAKPSPRPGLVVRDTPYFTHQVPPCISILVTPLAWAYFIHLTWSIFCCTLLDNVVTK